VRPVLFQFVLSDVSVTMYSYGTFMVLAWIAGVAVATFAAHRMGLRWQKVLLLLSLSLMVGIAGSRAFDLWIASAFYADDPSRIFAFDFQGFSLYGGLLLAGLTGLILSRLWDVPLWRLADSTVPGIATGVVLMRTGCFLNGCCHGGATTLPWGVTFPAGSPAWTHQLLTGQIDILGAAGLARPVHPTQLYEMAAVVIMCLAALWLQHRNMPSGVAFLVFAIGFTLFRIGNGFLRVRQPQITAPEWFYPVFYGGLVAIFVGLLLSRLRHREPQKSDI